MKKKINELLKKKESYKQIDGTLPLSKDHICFKLGHNMYKVCEINNGMSIFGDHKCSRCGYIEPFQYDYQTIHHT